MIGIKQELFVLLIRVPTKILNFALSKCHHSTISIPARSYSLNAKVPYLYIIGYSYRFLADFTFALDSVYIIEYSDIAEELLTLKGEYEREGVLP
ncbi:MAG: hypothetical protein ACMUIU_16660 [bacterium]